MATFGASWGGMWRPRSRGGAEFGGISAAQIQDDLTGILLNFKNNHFFKKFFDRFRRIPLADDQSELPEGESNPAPSSEHTRDNKDPELLDQEQRSEAAPSAASTIPPGEGELIDSDDQIDQLFPEKDAPESSARVTFFPPSEELEAGVDPQDHPGEDDLPRFGEGADQYETPATEDLPRFGEGADQYETPATEALPRFGEGADQYETPATEALPRFGEGADQYETPATEALPRFGEGADQYETPATEALPRLGELEESDDFDITVDDQSWDPAAEKGPTPGIQVKPRQERNPLSNLRHSTENTGRLRIAELQQKVQQEEDAERSRELEITLLEQDQELDPLPRPQMPVKMSEESVDRVQVTEAQGQDSVHLVFDSFSDAPSEVFGDDPEGVFAVDHPAAAEDQLTRSAPLNIAPASRFPSVKSGTDFCVAMDFGTSRSSVAVLVDGAVELLPLLEGQLFIPSIIGLLEDGSMVIGEKAKQLQLLNPGRVLHSPKRLLGRQYKDREIEPYLSSLAMPSSAGPNGQVVLGQVGQEMTVQQFSASILDYLKLVAQRFLNHPVEEVVLTCPVTFDEERHRALNQVARIAGLKAKFLVDEPAAAALANHQSPAFKGLVGVYDFGGGTFDFSVIDADSSKLDVVTTAGDSWLGGDDFDEAIAGWAADKFWREHGIELRSQLDQWQRLLRAAEQAKWVLSTSPAAVISVPEVALTASGPLHLRIPITRQELEAVSKELIERSLNTCELALELSDIKPEEINAVFLSGGTSHIPAIQQGLTAFFKQPPVIAIPPEYAVVYGASIYAALFGQASALHP